MSTRRRRPQVPHGAILKIVSTNICGSDQHMVRGRTTAPAGLILGHEITGEVIEKARTSSSSRRATSSRSRSTSPAAAAATARSARPASASTNPDRPGAAYGYVDMGGWVGGQAEYVMVPYADFNLPEVPGQGQAMEKILDLTMLSDIFPTGYHGAFTAGVTSGPTVYVAGAGPVGLAAAHSAQLLGAAVVYRRRPDPRAPRAGGRASAASRSTSPRATRGTRSTRSSARPRSTAAVDAVGFEAHGHGEDAGDEAPATVLNSLMTSPAPAARSASPAST